MPIPDHLVEQHPRAPRTSWRSSRSSTRLKRSGRTLPRAVPPARRRGAQLLRGPRRGLLQVLRLPRGRLRVFTFLMKHLGMTYPDAIRLGGRAGARRSRCPTSAQERPRRKTPTRHYYDVNAFARDWFRKRERALGDATAARRARDYLERRGVSREWAERFRAWGGRPRRGPASATRRARHQHSPTGSCWSWGW